MPRHPKTIEQQMARREYHRRDRVKAGQHTVNHIVYRGPPDADVIARLAEIPIDTRDLTARLFGDPLPGRGFSTLLPSRRN